MTSPAAITDHVGDHPITPNTPVLQNRELHPDADRTTLPRFGDAQWDLTAARPDRHQRERIHWNGYPAAFRHACKLYAFALINIVEDVPRLAGSRSDIPAINTLQESLRQLKVFLTWLQGRDITRFVEVGTVDLDDYQRYITDHAATSTHWKRMALLAVQRLHAYRDYLPEEHRLPSPRPWGGASAAELAEHPAPKLGENRTPRVHPDVMHPLLSAALLVTSTIAADLLPTARRLIAMRHLAHQVAPSQRRLGLQGTARRHAVKQHCDRLLPALIVHGLALPGRRVDGQTTIDIDGLTIGGWLDRVYLRKWPALREAVTSYGLPIKVNLFRVNRFSSVDARPWRTQPVDASELLVLLRHLTTACFLTIAYLSGIRMAEALNLRRGCITRDSKLGLIFMSGQQVKTRPQRRERSPQTIPWVVIDQVAHAVSILEDLATGEMLFPTGEICSMQWIDDTVSSSRRPSSINNDIATFINWFNTDIAPATGHPVIGEDPHGTISAQRLRRTLAWHIVRRPGGTVAGSTQYGHLYTRVVHGYAGRANSGFLDEITFEEFLLRAETLHEDHQRLAQGEHVSGPAADAYKTRVTAAGRFAGLTITTPAQVNNAMTNPDLQVHHGALLTCVYRPATAACRDATDSDSGPSWPRCRLTCRNAARTDRDITELRRHVQDLKSDLTAPGLPEPLRQRIQQRLDEHERAITEHDTTRPQPPTRQPQGPTA